MAATLSNLGLVAADRDDLALAHTRFEEALALDRASGERGAETYSLLNLGGVKIWMGDVDPGVAIVREALTVLADLDDADGVAEAVEHLALASRARGNLETAARLLFAARQVRARAGAPLREIDARRVNSALAAVRAALPARDAAIARSRGGCPGRSGRGCACAVDRHGGGLGDVSAQAIQVHHSATGGPPAGARRAPARRRVSTSPIQIAHAG